MCIVFTSVDGARTQSARDVEKRCRRVEFGQRSDREHCHNHRQRRKFGASVTVSKKDFHNSDRKTLGGCIHGSAANGDAYR
jgi:hypothetical protein